MIGQNVLGLADVEYDLPDSVVRLFGSDHCGKAMMAYLTQSQPHFEIAIEPRTGSQHHMVGTVELDGAKPIATFKIGAARPLSRCARLRWRSPRICPTARASTC
ncbi:MULTISPECIES: hypothetical protein [unclassified Sphingomonas]|uniref:hypothetical protein n=1 Tax=unclassified Sphingomonas TaxID=196159 RepID=UPI002867A6C4|nr:MULTISPECIES: hypothetical protein [unclassified Sphingomonas]MDR6116736.1 hypothetical protein [Sphingomonas sp. SORGH_AS_0789]MDR6151825.1 hypothetical protein [Sphingomonas sp. SORGH_AS_0742]